MASYRLVDDDGIVVFYSDIRDAIQVESSVELLYTEPRKPRAIVGGKR